MTYLSLTRGDRFTRRITVRDETGALVDLTGKTLRFTAKRSTADLDPAAVISKATGSGITHLPNQTGADKGLADLVIDGADTQALKGIVVLDWDLQLFGGGGPWTVDGGKLVITPDVTRAAS